MEYISKNIIHTINIHTFTLVWSYMTIIKTWWFKIVQMLRLTWNEGVQTHLCTEDPQVPVQQQVVVVVVVVVAVPLAVGHRLPTCWCPLQLAFEYFSPCICCVAWHILLWFCTPILCISWPLLLLFLKLSGIGNCCKVKKKHKTMSHNYEVKVTRPNPLCF